MSQAHFFWYLQVRHCVTLFLPIFSAELPHLTYDVLFKYALSVIHSF